MPRGMGSVFAVCRGRWRRIAAVSLGMLVCAYGAAYAAVALAGSDADQRIMLPDGEAIAYRVLGRPEGRGERVILVHGAPADSGSWDRLWMREAESLSHLEVVAVDRIGYGNSTGGEETSLAAHALGLEPLLGPGAILVGHSYGGPVAMRAAAEFPDRVEGVVLVAGACDPFMDDAQWFRRVVDGLGPAVPEPWHVANAELLALTDENRAMIPLLERVTCPVVVVHGTWDPVCPHDGTIEFLRDALPNAASVEVVSLPRAGHNLHLSHTGKVADAIRTLASARSR